jgi:hypothetical protein
MGRSQGPEPQRRHAAQGGPPRKAIPAAGPMEGAALSPRFRATALVRPAGGGGDHADLRHMSTDTSGL